jgi:SAM-dependent methyltransferase
MNVPQKRKNYQSFPDQAGGSKSFEKLVHLRLPAFEGKTFLDVGCNEGFFCGFARQQGATRAVGIDMSGPFIERARERFPDCEFLQQTWDRLPDEKFDVILLASAIHYADDQPALIERLVEQLTPDGTLVLELGLATGPSDEWVEVKRSIDTRFFPTKAKLNEVLAPYAWKYVGKSVGQGGDPIPRHVVHIKKRLPVAYLLMMPPSYGKTSLAKGVFSKAGVKVAGGDTLLTDIAKGDKPCSPKLRSVVARHFESASFDRAKVMKDIFDSNLGDDFIDAWASLHGPVDTAFDCFVPPQFHGNTVNRLRALGYFPVSLNWTLPNEPLMSVAQAQAKADAYYDHLNSRVEPGAKAAKQASPAAAAAAPTPVQRRGNDAAFVDTLSLDSDGITITGWAVNGEGNPLSAFDVTLSGAKHRAAASKVVRRRDVMLKFGLTRDDVGYVLRLEIPAAQRSTMADFAVRDGGSNAGKVKNFSLSAAVKKILSP